jgi:hypothetical protein
MKKVDDLPLRQIKASAAAWRLDRLDLPFFEHMVLALEFQDIY